MKKYCTLLIVFGFMLVGFMTTGCRNPPWWASGDNSNSSSYSSNYYDDNSYPNSNYSQSPSNSTPSGSGMRPMGSGSR